MLAITPRGEWNYIAESDRETDNPTVFKLRDLKQRERMTLFDEGKGFGSKAFDIVKTSLIGVDNLLDGDGKSVPFKKDASGKADDEFLERIPWQIILEIAGAVVRGGELEDDEVEKSEPSPEV
jgi:hypothetical protein